MKEDTFYQVFISYFLKLLQEQTYVKGDQLLQNQKLIIKATTLFIQLAGKVDRNCFIPGRTRLMEQVRKHFILRGCLTILLVVFRKSSGQVQDLSRILQFFAKTSKADWKTQLDFLMQNQFLTLDKGKG